MPYLSSASPPVPDQASPGGHPDFPRQMQDQTTAANRKIGRSLPPRPLLPSRFERREVFHDPDFAGICPPGSKSYPLSIRMK